MNTRQRNIAALAITILGCSAMLGDLTNSPKMKGLGVSWCFAPIPKVFCDNQQLEAFASEFTIVTTGDDGSITKIRITPELYSRMPGPYNRRNVYGAALSFGPKLPESLWRPVFEYGLGARGALTHEFNLPCNTTNVSVTIQTRTAGRADRWVLCNP
jgi:hypothetical protein